MSPTIHLPLSSLLSTHLKNWASSDRLSQLDTVLWLEHHIHLLEKHHFSPLDEKMLNVQIEILSLLLEARLYESSHQSPSETRDFLNAQHDCLLSSQLDSIHQKMDCLITAWLASLPTLCDVNKNQPLQTARKLINKRTNDSFEKRAYLNESTTELHPCTRPLTAGKSKSEIGLRKFVHCKV